MQPTLRTSQEIIDMEKAGAIAKIIFAKVEEALKPGITSLELDKIANKIIKDNHAIPLFLNHEGYKYTICASPNSAVVHGVPNNKPLKEGDIITIDIGVKFNGMCVDTARTFPVGKISDDNKELIDLTNKSLAKAVEMIKPNITVGDIGFTIENFFKKYKKYNISEEYVGHFIGKNLWEDPMIPNKNKKGVGLKLKAGMTFCVEPVVIAGKDELFVDPLDKWTVYTKHNGNAAHVEHTILVTTNGAKIIV